MANYKIARKRLAQRLLQNWLHKTPLDSINTGVCNIDDGLQSLGWLRNLTVRRPIEAAPAIVNNNVVPAHGIEVADNLCDNRKSVHQPPATYVEANTEAMDYKHNPYVKPPHSYASLIAMAINNTKDKKINISAIYKWISDNFPYYKMAECHWQNSIRHNLSLSKRFEKVPRRPTEPGKGGFWRITPGSEELIEGDPFSIKRSLVSIIPTAKRVKTEEDSSAARNILSGDDPNIYYDVEEKDAEKICKKDFNWSAALTRDICVDGVKIKTENILDEDDYGRSTQSYNSSDVDDDASRSPLPIALGSDVTSDDLSCFDDLLVFNFTDKTREQRLSNEDALDLSVTADGSGDHDWWQKALELGEEPDLVSEKKKVKRDDCKDIFTQPLSQDLDICDLFSIEGVF